MLTTAVIVAWIMANKALAIAIAVAVYAFVTGRITLSGLATEVWEDVKKVLSFQQPDAGLITTPSKPLPSTPAAVLQELVGVLSSAVASGNKELLDAAVTVLVHTSKTTQKED